jgi:hypothetical protein
MTDLILHLQSVADMSKVPHSLTRVEQKTARAIRETALADLEKSLISAVANNPDLKVISTRDGIAVQIDNEDAGMITIVFDATVKSLDYDAETEHDDMVAEQKAKAEKEAEKAKAKAAKIKATKSKATKPTTDTPVGE